MIASARVRLGALHAAVTRRTVDAARPARQALAVAVIASAALALTAAPAFAGHIHPFQSSFDGADTTAGAFSDVSRVAVDQATGDVYVVDGTSVDKFNASGVAQNFSALGSSSLTSACFTAKGGREGAEAAGNRNIAIDNSGGPNDGDIYVNRNDFDGGDSDLCAYDPAGNFLWRLTPPGFAEGLAIDSAGHIWTGNDATNTAEEFDNNGSAGNPPALIASVAVGPVSGLAFNSAGSPNELFAVEAGGGGVNRYTSEAPSGRFDPGPAFAAAVDPVTGHLYVVHPDQFDEYETSGPPAPSFSRSGVGLLSGAIGIAVNGTGAGGVPAGTVYVSEPATQSVDVFGPAETTPTPTTGVAFPVGPNTATLHGIAEPDIDHAGPPITGCEFEYVSNAAFQAGGYANAAAAPCTPATPYSVATAVSADLSTLHAATLYHYRLVTTTADGPEPGVDRTFETPVAVQEVVTGGASEIGKTTATLSGSFTGDGNDTHYYFEYGTSTSYGQQSPAPPGADQGASAGTQNVSTPLVGLSGNTIYHYRLVAENKFGTTAGGDQSFETLPAVTGLQTEPATNLTNDSATLHATFIGDGQDTHYYFQYGSDTSYGHLTAIPPGDDAGSTTGTNEVQAEIAGLLPGATYHFRVVASNASGVTVASNDETLTTFQAPSIESFSSSALSATGADLHAQIDPEGFATTYHFEYGTTSAYGQVDPVPDGTIGEELSLGHPVTVHLANLTEGSVYHFRVLATNRWGTTASADQTFNFYPPPCPNAAIRQQTNSARLPDCRAYELASPTDAGGAILIPSGPNTGYASSPSRLTFVGRLGAVPGSGSPPNGAARTGDLYAATRTTSGWVSRYIGLPADQASCVGGPPVSWKTHQYEVLTTPTMDRFLDWDHGGPGVCNSGELGEDKNTVDLPSNAPYLWNAEGQALGHFPSNLSALSGAGAALECPQDSLDFLNPVCTSVSTASADLNHIVFSSQNFALAAGGLTTAPGSAYDDDVATGAISLISKTESGGPIPGGPSQVIRFLGLSDDGSHILMAAGPVPLCGLEGCSGSGPAPLGPTRLYMRVDDESSYDIAPGHAVTYVGMTSDGATVFFTSEEQLNGEDHDTSTDLYMWSEAGQKEGKPLTLISKGDNEGNPGEPGNTDACSPALIPTSNNEGSFVGEEAPWTSKCGVSLFSNFAFEATLGFSLGSYADLPLGQGGNGHSDNLIASANGDIYFYSPEQLDGEKGTNGQENLYVFRDGRTQYVTTLSPGRFCVVPPNTRTGFGEVCTAGPLARLQVAPDDSHAAFVTASRLTSYENAGHLEMYTYEPATEKLLCVSCNPDGEPPTHDVLASADGLFMSNDGRAFFSTVDSLVPQDTNEASDVYEFVDGRPQLISSGTGSGSYLDGVSADGTDAYFFTDDDLIPGDRNGNQRKFYDARSDGGFPVLPGPPPCAAADECHGAGSSEPIPQTPGTASPLGAGGNVKPIRKHRPKKHHPKKGRHKQGVGKRRSRTANHGHGSSK